MMTLYEMKKIYVVNLLTRVWNEQKREERVCSMALKAFENKEDADYFCDWYRDVKFTENDIHIWTEPLAFVEHSN